MCYRNRKFTAVCSPLPKAVPTFILEPFGAIDVKNYRPPIRTYNFLYVQL